MAPPSNGKALADKEGNRVIQIEIENGTTFRRRIFLHALQLPVNEPIPLALTAWKVFDLAPGTSTGTVDGDSQIGVHVSRIVHGVDHQTVVSDASDGDSFRVQLADGLPALARTQGAGASIKVSNEVTGPESTIIDVTLYRDYAPFLSQQVRAGESVSFDRATEFYCYSSMPFESGAEALALEATAGSVSLTGSNIRLQLVPAGSNIHWKVNGQSADVT
jgi:hypothetical protein